MNRKINLNRPEVSADEIAKRKNFDSILKANVKVSKPLIKKPWFLSSIVVATVAIVTTAVLLNKKRCKPNNIKYNC
ncbi:MAG: hypothetical protein IPH89_13270 [Bacteroidetes bacterium]|nr:hypothetical protein [Bacteroidota bacterium]